MQANTNFSAWLRDRVKDAGILPFWRFMHLALYHPDHGYYEKSLGQVGRQGDFFTSVSVGPLFGELLGWQFAHWAAQASWPRWQIVEAGAHDGALALDILSSLRDSSAVPKNSFRYVIVEPSARRRQAQQQKLAGFNDIVTWIADWAEFEPAKLKGIIFANELLDAFPVFRFAWNGARGGWQEWGVGCEQDRFTWQIISDSQGINASCEESNLRQEALAILEEKIPSDLHPGLPAGFTVEICPEATRWWRKAGSHLDAGYLVTLDYGLTKAEFWAAGRTTGNLKAIRNHCVVPDALANPGDQDITAPIDFSQLQATGEQHGLQTISLVRQEIFLTNILATMQDHRPSPMAWDANRIRQFQTLIHPSHLGWNFKALVQRR